MLEWPPGSSHQELSYPFFTFFFLFLDFFLILDAPRNRRRTERYKNKIKLVFAGGEIPLCLVSFLTAATVTCSYRRPFIIPVATSLVVHPTSGRANASLPVHHGAHR